MGFSAQERMIEDQLIARGIRNKSVIRAFFNVPRERFTLKEYAHLAYQDGPLPIDHEQTISQPFIVGLMTQALDVKRNHKVLEIGTGSGYQTAILAELSNAVYTVERINGLHDKAKAVLDALGYTTIQFFIGDGAKGLEAYAPFDRIIVTAAARKVPENLVKQLANHGKMVIPVGGSWFQDLLVLTKENGTITTENLGGCRFVPLIEAR